MKTAFLCLMTLLALLAIGHTSLVTDLRNYMKGTQSDLSLDVYAENAYRACLHRESGSVGVTTLQQMNKCKEESGYGR